MIFTALFVAYFFPPRMAWPLMALFVYAYATPLLYDTERDTPRGIRGPVSDVRRWRWRDGRGDAVPEGPAGPRRVPPARDGGARPLTGGEQPAGFDVALEDAAASEQPYALILIDLDDFKRTNDEQGHPAGDAVLRSVA